MFTAGLGNGAGIRRPKKLCTKNGATQRWCPSHPFWFFPWYPISISPLGRILEAHPSTITFPSLCFSLLLKTALTTIRPISFLTFLSEAWTVFFEELPHFVLASKALFRLCRCFPDLLTSSQLLRLFFSKSGCREPSSSWSQEGRLVVAELSLAEKRLLVTSCLTFSGSGWLVKYGQMGGRTQQRSSRTDLPFRPSAPLLAPLFGLPCSPSPCSSPLFTRFCPPSPSCSFPRQARASSLAHCTHSSVPILQTSSTNRPSILILTTLFFRVRASSRLASYSSARL